MRKSLPHLVHAMLFFCLAVVCRAEAVTQEENVKWFHVFIDSASFHRFEGGGLLCVMGENNYRATLTDLRSRIEFLAEIQMDEDGKTRILFRPQASDGSWQILEGRAVEKHYHGGSSSFEVFGSDSTGAYVAFATRADNAKARKEIPPCKK